MRSSIELEVRIPVFCTRFRRTSRVSVRDSFIPILHDLASLGFAVLVLAIDFAVIRIAFREPALDRWETFELLLPDLTTQLFSHVHGLCLRPKSS